MSSSDEPRPHQPPSDPQTGPEPDDLGDGLDRVVEQLQAEEAEAQIAHLSSFESFEFWLKTNPAFHQPGIYDMLVTYGPGLLQVIKRMLGL